MRAHGMRFESISRTTPSLSLSNEALPQTDEIEVRKKIRNTE